MIQDMLKRLTDNYAKDPNSRIGKLLSIFYDELKIIDNTYARIKAWRDIDKAQGSTLDRIGTNVVQPRGVATDEVYRILLKSKIARNLSTGDINTIIRVLAVALNTVFTDIKIEEMFNDLHEPEPAAIKVIELPFDKVNAAGMSPRQFARIVQRTVAAGVRVGIIEMTGTFSFGEEVPEVVPFIYGSDMVDPQHMIDPTTPFPDTFDGFLNTFFGIEVRPGSVFVPEFDPEAGFADIDGTIGGYFGAAFSSDDDQDLPI